MDEIPPIFARCIQFPISEMTQKITAVKKKINDRPQVHVSVASKVSKMPQLFISKSQMMKNAQYLTSFSDHKQIESKQRLIYSFICQLFIDSCSVQVQHLKNRLIFYCCSSVP